MKLLPTLHCLVFAINTCLEPGEEVEGVMTTMRAELSIMVTSLAQFQLTLPLVVLACRGAQDQPATTGQGAQSARYMDLRQVVEGLQLHHLTR